MTTSREHKFCEPEPGACGTRRELFPTSWQRLESSCCRLERTTMWLVHVYSNEILLGPTGIATEGRLLMQKYSVVIIVFTFGAMS